MQVSINVHIDTIKKSKERKAAEKACSETCYVTEVFCDNCSKPVVMTIIKGMTVEEMATKATCPFCRCRLWEDEDNEND